MSRQPGQSNARQIGGVELECLCIGPAPSEATTIVMLHEGLGCISMWWDFPENVHKATCYGVFVCSRQGYGGSDPCELPRPVHYLRCEAQFVLPLVLDAIKLRIGMLFGHSDGGIIVGLRLGMHQDHRVCGLILMAPHFYIEPEKLDTIAAVEKAFEVNGLRDRLRHHHDANVDYAFWGWSKACKEMGSAAWGSRDAIAYIRVPVLYIQGEDEAYGSNAQADAVVDECNSPVDVELLPNCQHSPHLEQPERTLSPVTDFIIRLNCIEDAIISAV